MTIFEKIEADMNAVEGTALEKLMESFYHTAMKYCNNPNKYLEDKLLYYFGINVDDYKCKDEKQLDEIGKDITVMLNALYLGKITCATCYMKRILEKSRNVENSPVIIAFAKNVDMIIRSCMFTSPVLKASHALIDEFHLFQHLSTITDIQHSLEWSARDNLVAVLFEHLFKKESDYPKDDPKPLPKPFGGVMIDSGFVKADNDKPTAIEPPTPSSTPSVDTIINAPRKGTSPYLPDIDAHAKVFVEQNNVITYLDESNGLYWCVMEGIVQRKTSKKWSIYNTRYSAATPCGYITFFDAIDRFYNNVLIDNTQLFGWMTKLNTFISVLRANISYFRTSRARLNYVTSSVDGCQINMVLEEVCDRIKQYPKIKELCKSCPTEHDPFDEINRLYRLIAANYYNLVDITFDKSSDQVKLSTPPEKKQKHDETRLLDVDILARKFLRDASATHTTDTIDSQTELYWDVFDGISELNTDKKWSIFSDPNKDGDIAFFDAIHRFYKGVLIHEDEFGTPSGEVKINTFIAMLRANFSCFRNPVDTDIHYLTPQTGSTRRICLEIRDRLILRGLYSTPVCPETQFNPAIYLNYLFKLIEANYHKLLSE